MREIIFLLLLLQQLVVLKAQTVLAGTVKTIRERQLPAPASL
jgi:hypothetical protein